MLPLNETMVLFIVSCRLTTGFSVSIGDHSSYFHEALTISFGCSQPRVLPLAFAAVTAWLLGYGHNVLVDEPSMRWRSVERMARLLIAFGVTR